MPVSATAIPTAETVTQIDRMIAEVWEAYELKPSAEADDSRWVRRLFLDVLGRIPTAAEASEFIADRDSEKKQKLVRRLLYDQRYAAEFARQWTTIWTNLLIGRTGGMANNTLIEREGMQDYLRTSILADKPWDQLARELITATGTTRPGTEGYNGATNYLIEKVNDDNASQATASTSQIFLGLQVQCTQCHNHPFNDWKQKKYWEMNSFFRQARAVRESVEEDENDRYGKLIDRNFAGERGNRPDEAEVYYEMRNGLVAVAWPVFIDGTVINPSGDVAVVNRREQFADLAIQSPYFAKAFVNRMWAHFLGYGFTSPVDDLGPHNISTHPALLEYLAQEVRSNQFRVRPLIEAIVLSRPYSLSSRARRGNAQDDPLMGQPPRFSRFYLRQMQAEQLYESLQTVGKEMAREESAEQQANRKRRWLRQFTTAFGNDEGGESNSFNGSIAQVLTMFNSEMIRDATSAKPGSLVYNVAWAKGSAREKVDAIFLAGLSRKARRDEMALAENLVKANGGDVAKGLQDLWWAILNTNEFILVH